MKLGKNLPRVALALLLAAYCVPWAMPNMALAEEDPTQAIESDEDIEYPVADDSDDVSAFVEVPSEDMDEPLELEESEECLDEPLELEESEEYLDESLEMEAQSSSWRRLSGKNAYDTMSAIVRADGAFPDAMGGTVIVATGDGYWDALAASGLAGTLGCPVLITPTKSLAEQTRSELVRLAPQRVLVMGGKAAVSPEVVSQITGIVPSVMRISGSTAVDTAIEIYKSGSDWSDTCIIATSTGYWDALSIAPYSYASKAPIFLTGAGNELTSATVSTIKGAGFSRAIIVGGRAVVAGSVESQLKSAGCSEVTRLSGANAIETSAEIAKWELGQGMTREHLSVATINGYWDALTGASLCGQENSILVLTNVKGGVSAVDAVYNQGTSDVIEGHVFGGRAAVSDDNLTYLETGTMPVEPEPGPSQDTGTNPGPDQGTHDYVANARSYKFHYPWCSSVNKMADHNKVYITATHDEMIAKGYDPCDNCNP